MPTCEGLARGPSAPDDGKRREGARSEGGVAYPARSVDVKVDAANPRLGARRPGADDGARGGLWRDGPGAVTARAGYRSRDGRDARERHHAPARHPSPGRSNARSSLVGENPSFVTLWAGFCQAAYWAPSLFACAVALDSTRLARVLSNDTKRRCASVEPVQSPGRGLSMAEGRKRLAPSHSSPLFLIHFQCLISHAATRPSSVFNFGVTSAKL